MKIIADENIPYVKDSFKPLGNVVTLAGRSIGNAELRQADILLVRSVTQVNQELLEDTPVKFIATATSGTNHIDKEYLQKAGIIFADALGSNASSVAQYVASAICYWSILKDKPLKQLSIGIVGYGHVGKKVQAVCQRLGIKCVINDPPLAKTDKHSKCNYKSLEVALKCDVVSLHVPLTTSGKYATQYLIDNKEINRIHSDSLLINAARGGVLNETALLDRKLKYDDIDFVLDVWENEPKLNLHVLDQALIATPHIAGYSFDGKILGTQMIYQACCDFLNEEPKWSITQVKCDEQQQSIDSKNIRSNVLKAYDILKDDTNLRKIKSHAVSERSVYFDSLRKNYTIRREWK